MSVTVQKLDGNMAELTITIPADRFDAELVKAYNKNKNRFQIPGFRKGKVPMQMIEKMYGPAVFYEDAANDLINSTYPDESDASELDIVSRPEIEVKQVEKGKEFIYTAKVAVKPPVKLGDYKNIEIEKIDTIVTEADVDAEIEKVRKDNSRKVDVTDRAAKNDDETIIDFEGFVDGKAFDGGKGSDYALVLGSHSFIDTFEDQIVGKSVGDEFDVNVTFPENYQAAELAGKPAVFKVKLKAIKELQLPELDDELVSEISDFDTVAEYREDVLKRLTEDKKKKAESEKENKAVEKLVEESEIEIPAPMLRYQQEQMFDDMAMRMQYQGLKMEQYLEITKQTREDMLDQFKDQAEKRILASLVVEAVADAEKLEASEEDVDMEIRKMADQYQIEVEKFKEMVGDKELDSVKNEVRMRKAIEFLRNNVKEV